MEITCSWPRFNLFRFSDFHISFIVFFHLSNAFNSCPFITKVIRNRQLTVIFFFVNSIFFVIFNFSLRCCTSFGERNNAFSMPFSVLSQIIVRNVLQTFNVSNRKSRNTVELLQFALHIKVALSSSKKIILFDSMKALQKW